jgi:hypothetical protein
MVIGELAGSQCRVGLAPSVRLSAARNRQAALGVSCFRRVPCRAMAGSQARPVTMTACSWRSTAAAMTVCAWVGVSLLFSRPVRCR